MRLQTTHAAPHARLPDPPSLGPAARAREALTRRIHAARVSGDVRTSGDPVLIARIGEASFAVPAREIFRIEPGRWRPMPRAADAHPAILGLHCAFGVPYAVIDAHALLTGAARAARPGSEERAGEQLLLRAEAMGGARVSLLVGRVEGVVPHAEPDVSPLDLTALARALGLKTASEIRP